MSFCLEALVCTCHLHLEPVVTEKTLSSCLAHPSSSLSEIDGLIISNTTIERPGPIADHKHGQEAGGLSGRPVFARSTEVLRRVYQLTGGAIPIVGCGGVGSGEEAYAKIRAGASLVELYTSMVYEGPAIVPRIKRELAALLARDGFASVHEAVGADHKKK
jgi:dihydroorotate dehydrogenase